MRQQVTGASKGERTGVQEYICTRPRDAKRGGGNARTQEPQSALQANPLAWTPSPPSPRERGRLVIHIRLRRQSERAQSSPVHARWQVPGGSHTPAGCMRRARGIEGASRAPPCEARDLRHGRPRTLLAQKSPPERARLLRRLRARHGAPPRVQAFRGHCMCMLWYEGSGRAVRPRRGHKFFGFCCSARRAAPHHPQPCNDITPTGAWREHATRGARGVSLPWLGAPHAPGTAAYRRRAAPRCMCAPRQARRQGQEGHAPEGSRRPDRRTAAGTLRGRCATK